MDTFIVRIYRRIASRSREAAGTVEHVETGERVGFTGAKELFERLLGPATALDEPESDVPSKRDKLE